MDLHNTKSRPQHKPLEAGETLAAMLERLDLRALQPAERARLFGIILRTCDVLEHKHAQGVVHGALEPSCVVVGRDGTVSIIDRDASPRDAARQASLSAYMATEQAWGRGTDTDARTDVHGIGGLLYFVLTQTPPHHCGNALDVDSAKQGAMPIVQQAFELPLICRLRRVATRALSASPSERHPSMALLKQDIERCLSAG